MFFRWFFRINLNKYLGLFHQACFALQPCAPCAWPRSARRSGRSSIERFPAQRGVFVSAHEDGPTGGRVQSGRDGNIIGWVIFHRHGTEKGRTGDIMGVSFRMDCWDMLGYVGIWGPYTYGEIYPLSLHGIVNRRSWY